MRIACDYFGADCKKAWAVERDMVIDKPRLPWVMVRRGDKDYYFCGLQHLEQWAYCNQSGDNCK